MVTFLYRGLLLRLFIASFEALGNLVALLQRKIGRPGVPILAIDTVEAFGDELRLAAALAGLGHAAVAVGVARLLLL